SKVFSVGKTPDPPSRSTHPNSTNLWSVLLFFTLKQSNSCGFSMGITASTRQSLSSLFKLWRQT
ncbi:MAG: hypothetical protein UH071_11885, partial [Paludibacteraceae bacterium]|nr:hypothetical protein [Paludibacteraceae bacterium]